MKNLKKWMAAAGVGLALMTASVAALPAAAAGSTAAVVQHGSGPVSGASGEYLAQALGVSADELEAAKQTAYQAAIDQALADGLLTQAQADTIAERAAASGRLSSRYLRGLTSGDSAIDLDALLADALGVTADELDAARSEAQSLALAAAVAAGDITQEQADQMQAGQALKAYLEEQGFSTQVQTLAESLVQQAVQAGVITQAQADTILSDADFGALRGLGGAHGGRHGGRGLNGAGDTLPNDASGTTGS